MCPMPAVNQVYSVVVSEEGQREGSMATGILGANPTSSGQEVAMFFKMVETRMIILKDGKRTTTFSVSFARSEDTLRRLAGR